MSDAMFAVLLPICLAPLIITLFWAERAAVRLEKKRKFNTLLDTSSFRSRSPQRTHSSSPSRSPQHLDASSQLRSITASHSAISPIEGRVKKYWTSVVDSFHTAFSKTKHLAIQLDLLGLMLLGAGVGMIILPLTLSRKVETGVKWGSGVLLLLSSEYFEFLKEIHDQHQLFSLLFPVSLS